MLGLSANLSTLYQHLPFGDRLGAAAADGFGCVEFWTTEEADAVAQEVRRRRLSVSVVNVDGGREPHDAGGLSDPTATARWRQRFDETLRLALEIGNPAINTPAGRVDGSYTFDEALATAVENLTWALDRVNGEHVLVLLEPLSSADRPRYLLPTLDDAEALRAKLGSPDELKILFDAYHLHQSSGDVVGLFERSSHSVGHVQLADYPGRGAPGTGEIDYERFLEAVARSSYRGWVGLEYFAGEETSAGLAWVGQVRHVVSGTDGAGVPAQQSPSQSEDKEEEQQ